MIKAMRRFADCVESLRMAEKDYEKNETPAGKQIIKELQEKVDAWLKWIREKENEELAASIPPFIRYTQPKGSGNGEPVISNEIILSLTRNHSKEEIERFLESFNKPFFS